MSNTRASSGIRDNHSRGLVGDFLRAKIKPTSRLSVVSAYFTIYAYEILKQHLDQIGHLDFIFGEPRFILSLDPEKTEKKAFILDGNPKVLIRQSSDHVSAIKTEIDQQVYALYELTPEEIKIVEDSAK